MAIATNLGFPRIGPKRELKKIIEQYWANKVSREELLAAARALERDNWLLQGQVGIQHVPSADFSLYDHVLDHTVLFNAIPQRFRSLGADLHPLDLYFAMARGRAQSNAQTSDVAAFELTKWFDTNYHYLVPEFDGSEDFRLNQNNPATAFLRAKEAGVLTRPVVLGPVSFLLSGKAKKVGLKRFQLLNGLLPVYEELMRRLVQAGAPWVQIDEPCLVLDLEPEAQLAVERSLNRLASAAPALKILVATYFSGLGPNLDLALQLPVHGLHLDLVRGVEQLSPALNRFPSQMSLSLGLVNGRNVWRTNLGEAISMAEQAAEKLSPERVMIGPSCSLLHSPVDLAPEKRLDPEVSSWLAFGAQKLGEISVITKAINQGRGAVKAELLANERVLSSRRSSGHSTHTPTRQLLADVKAADFERHHSYPVRRLAQVASLDLPLLPLTTIGSFPQTAELRKQRHRFKQGDIGTAEYDSFLKQEIAQAIQIQEELAFDVLVHGEPERNDMVEYFGERLAGFAFTENGWVQSYGTRCVKPPIIYGDVYRPNPMTVAWWQYAQSLTKRPVKGMLTGPVTILQWSFVRDDQPRRDTCFQIALAIRQEMLDLEAAGCRAIQIDEPAVREGLPLRREQAQEYLGWAVKAFQLASAGVQDSTQIHTHMCYSEFNEIIDAIAQMDADVISIESARSQMELLDAFAKHKYPNEIGPGIYDIHSPRIPTSGEMIDLLQKAMRVISPGQLWVNPDCGLKTRKWEEVVQALRQMTIAAQTVRASLAESES